MSIGRILSPKRGTCWLISPLRAITAAHCVGSIGTTADVEFEGSTTKARVLDRDTLLDAAILDVAPFENSAPPLPICCRPISQVASSWSAIGFPPALDSSIKGLTIGGEIRNFQACRRTADDTIQLQCDEGGLEHIEDAFDDLGNPVQVFAGMSGAAVRASASTDRVVGLLVQSPPITKGKVILITPMDLIVERFKETLPSVNIQPWDDAPFLDIRRSDIGSCRITAFPSIQEIAKSWDSCSKPLRINCDLSPGEAPKLQSALLRLVVHSDNNGALEFFDHNDWREAAIQAAKSGLPICDFVAASAINPMPWMALTSHTPKSTVPFELTTAAAAREIHTSCNRWTLRRLASQIVSVLNADSTVDSVDFDIAHDLRDPMRELWNKWLEIFQNDPSFLDHFLTLMLTADGDFDVCADALIAAGPRTVRFCLVRLVAYTLAVNCCIQECFQPSRNPPGNLGNAEHAGHACGIETYRKKRLHIAINDHKWRTPVVFLPHLAQEASVLYAASLLLNESSSMPNTSLASALPRTWLLTGSTELLLAMGQSRSALTAFLYRKGKEFYTIQKSYIPQKV